MVGLNADGEQRVALGRERLAAVALGDSDVADEHGSATARKDSGQGATCGSRAHLSGPRLRPPRRTASLAACLKAIQPGNTLVIWKRLTASGATCATWSGIPLGSSARVPHRLIRETRRDTFFLRLF